MFFWKTFFSPFITQEINIILQFNWMLTVEAWNLPLPSDFPRLLLKWQAVVLRRRMKSFLVYSVTHNALGCKDIHESLLFLTVFLLLIGQWKKKRGKCTHLLLPHITTNVILIFKLIYLNSLRMCLNVIQYPHFTSNILVDIFKTLTTMSTCNLVQHVQHR